MAGKALKKGGEKMFGFFKKFFKISEPEIDPEILILSRDANGAPAMWKSKTSKLSKELSTLTPFDKILVLADPSETCRIVSAVEKIIDTSE